MMFEVAAYVLISLAVLYLVVRFGLNYLFPGDT